MDRLLDTNKASELLSIHPREVRRLIREGRLRAKVQPLRGTGAKPQKFILASEIERYMRDLDDAKAASDVPMPHRRYRSGALAGVIEFVR